MPKTPLRRTSKRAAKPRTAVVATVAVSDEREPRGARRRRETRGRLLTAALQLMSEKGMEGVAINEITESADVGFGSFYNHFPSKEAIYDALLDWVFEGYADALDRLVVNLADPAEVVAVCVRHTLLRAQREPVWGRFLLREGFSARVMTRGLGQRLMRDIQKGIAAKRFIAKDPLMTFVAVGGTVLAAISAELQLLDLGDPQTATVQKMGLDTKNIAERTAAVLLRTLGLTPAEAEAVARRPLPVVEIPNNLS